MRVNVRAYPNARRTVVAGRYGNGEPPVLIVRVNAPAADGRANHAVIAALARAFGVPKGSVSLLSGAASRHKLMDVDGADPVDLVRLLAT
jgi:uncharacterized protein (TIGR00251 family)